MAIVHSLNHLIIQKIHLIKLCILRLPQRLRPRKLIDIYNMNTKKTETFFFSFSLEKPFFLLPSYYTECGIFLISTYFKNFSYISSMSFSFTQREIYCVEVNDQCVLSIRTCSMKIKISINRFRYKEEYFCRTHSSLNLV